MTFTSLQLLYAFANRVNERRNLSEHPEQTVKVGQFNAAGLIQEILHYAMGYYQRKNNSESFKSALDWAKDRQAPPVVEGVLTAFVDQFPPLEVQRGEQLPIDYLKDRSQERPNDQIAAAEVMLLYLANKNPAFSPFLEVFDDSDLQREVNYENLVRFFEEFFSTQPRIGPKNNSLVSMLREPVLASPDSISGQLDYIRDNWGSILPPELMYRLLLALDVIKEEEKLGFLGPGPALVPTFGRGMFEYAETAQFTKDKDWMPKVVLLAKVAHVWLDQLSQKYRKSITSLDQIPDEELDTLARWGFTGLWLIGLWQRSPASQRIKQLCGNPEALSSAYSIYDYVIADDLGGEQALDNLRHRACHRGIRLSCDMVPNHMGIYSKMILEHPDWFLQLDHPPYPSYGFTGENLSLDSRVGIYIEDGYWARRDAAVVFKYVDNRTNQVRHIYHGNDGTSTPWNDTAQLNFLRADVRESIIQLILYIARKFPIIRFDAAMTLTKKHYQRLWFPQPGTGGDIPSRSGRGLSRAEFDQLFPKEFWREVVDRITEEGIDTLLIAEAFWLMEGYFVRTLGMHRVYNSAFMNMLKMEENAKYRSVIKNVMEFNPEILRRFVNFMSNPDEETAVAQFGKENKYFGVAIMMVTMPGLPMIGHGQIEGFTEKYGMEYRKAYWKEEVDWKLVRRHEAEVFPLMRRRHLFSGVENFHLFDFYESNGIVNENVFAYSNRSGDERVLVLYHNKYDTAKGWFRLSSAFSVESEKPGERILIQENLAEALGLNTDGCHFSIFKDYKSGLEYIRSGRALAEQGLYAEIGAYQYHVFSDFREVIDDQQGNYARLAESLAGCGVPSMEEAYREMILSPVLYPFQQLVNPDMLRRLTEICLDESEAESISRQVLNFFTERMEVLLRDIALFTGAEDHAGRIVNYLNNLLISIRQLKDIKSSFPWKGSNEYESATSYLFSSLPRVYQDALPSWRVLLAWVLTHRLGAVKGEAGFEQHSAAWFKEWLFGKVITQTFINLGCDEDTARQETQLVKILASYHSWFVPSAGPARFSMMRKMLTDPEVQHYLGFNWYNGVQWLSKEALESLGYWMFVVAVVSRIADSTQEREAVPEDIVARYRVIREFIQRAEKVGYQTEKLLASFLRSIFP